MPAPHDLDPDAMTEEERIDKRRFEAGFAFEMMPEVEYKRRTQAFTTGATEHKAAP